MLGALAHGVPLLLLPHAADQFENAHACSAAGVASVVRPDALTAENVRAEVTTLMAEPGYGAAVRVVRDEIASMLIAEEVAERLTNGVSATRLPS